ncbi:hypothetical protein MBT84_19795 [Streptomyces sp. MBT84]|uniref:hypothetical protein n=1 Tax=Streptomyces sp. MBT84 TaxID=1488414 RepID=UPI001C6E35F8|nr:hypothetical protein [Streptomyces sp. MBT84]MBW8701853.1 hypothetical protein [Streptomyces sp. MBT84]
MSDQPRPECRHWIGAEGQYCKQVNGVRLYIPGHRCPLHTPRALRGLPEIPPGPGWPIHRTQEET